ncbi:MAG: hypothetical protein GY714_25315, partial [Desulfobacterales bacterium]|nr:hypothetical protein [Desulfobacterales bacterium]
MIKEAPVKTREIGEVESDLRFSDRAQSTLSKALTKAKLKFIAITPMNVVFDLMAKAKPGKGGVFNVYKKTMDLAHNKYVAHRQSIMRPMRELIVKAGIDNASLERILVWATLEQDGGRQKILASPEFTEAGVERFLKKGLSEHEQTTLDAMRVEFEKLKPQLIEVLKNVYNKDF